MKKKTAYPDEAECAVMTTEAFAEAEYVGEQANKREKTATQ